MAKIIFYFRTVLYSITLLTVSFLAVLIGLLCTLCGVRLNTNYYVARTFYQIAGRVMGWTFEVEGEEHLDKGLEGDSGKGRSAVMVGNHQR
jgi:phosphatidylinositol glycan class A protein